MGILFLCYMLFLSVSIQAQNETGLLATKKCFLFNTAYSDTPVEVIVYRNAYSLYYDPADANQCATMQKLGLKEYRWGGLFPIEDSVLGKVVYISPDSLKIINRFFSIRGNYFTSVKGNGIITRDVFIHFNVEMTDSAIHAFYRQNNIIECDTKTGCMQSNQPRFLYLRGEQVLDASLKISKDASVKQVYNLVEDGRKFKLSNCPCLLSCFIGSSNKVSTKNINGNEFLFVERGVMPFIYLQIYRVYETDSTEGDTVFVRQQTLAYVDHLEMHHVVQVADYEITREGICFYTYAYEWDELFNTDHQNPELYTTCKTTYIVQSDGSLVLVSDLYGQQDSKVKKPLLNARIKKRLKSKINFVEHWR